jgi:hypothetical protein
MTNRTFQLNLALAIVFGIGQVLTDNYFWAASFFCVLSAVGALCEANR